MRLLPFLGRAPRNRTARATERTARATQTIARSSAAVARHAVLTASAEVAACNAELAAIQRDGIEHPDAARRVAAVQARLRAAALLR